MKIAIRYDLPSLESDFLTQRFEEDGHDVFPIGPWAAKEAFCTCFDLAIGLGPVSWCPIAHRRLLLALGAISVQKGTCWDGIVVSSLKAFRNTKKRFGHDILVRQLEFPILDLQSGRNRLLEKQQIVLHCSTLENVKNLYIGDKFISMSSWADLSQGKGEVLPFNVRDFNSYVRYGALGLYLGAEDGYDIMVRRHLALGGKVFCPLDKEVLGDLIEKCCDFRNFSFDEIKGEKGELIDCVGNEDKFFEELNDFIGRL